MPGLPSAVDTLRSSSRNEINAAMIHSLLLPVV